VAFVVKKAGSVLSPKDVIDYVAKQVLLDKTDMSTMDIFEWLKLNIIFVPVLFVKFLF
jgi:hypothetical protein